MNHKLAFHFKSESAETIKRMFPGCELFESNKHGFDFFVYLKGNRPVQVSNWANMHNIRHMIAYNL